MIPSTAHIFTDDTKVYRYVLTEYRSDQQQEYLTRIVQWSKTWQMSVNIEKCKVIHLGHNNRQTMYNMGQTEPQTLSVKKDLRVFVDEACVTCSQQGQQDFGYDTSYFFLSR